MGLQNNYIIALSFQKYPNCHISFLDVSVMVRHRQRHRSNSIFTLALLQTTLNVKVQQQVLPQSTSFFGPFLFIHTSFMNCINLEYQQQNSYFFLPITSILVLFSIFHPLYRSLSCLNLQSFDNCSCTIKCMAFGISMILPLVLQQFIIQHIACKNSNI